MRHTRSLLLVVVACLVVPGCSSGAGSATTSTSTTTAVTTADSDWAEGLVVDDTGTFAFDAARYELPTDTSTVVTPLGEFPAISLSADLMAYAASPLANGITIAMVPSPQGSADDLIAGWFPHDGLCPEAAASASVDTLFGTALGLTFDGCGPDSDVARAVFAVDIVGRDVVLLVALRGAFSSEDAVLLAPEFIRVRFP